LPTLYNNMHNNVQIKLGLLYCMILVVLLLPLVLEHNNLITGQAVVQNKGCCAFTCQQTSESDCPSTFYVGQQCAEVASCNVGCCVDAEGYCLSNYLAGRCDAANGRFVTQHECLHEPLCITEPPLYDIRGFIGYPFVFTEQQDGLMFTDDIVGSPGDFLTLKSFIFGDTLGHRLRARVSSDDYEKLLALYDDGAHGDGNANDKLFGAIWRTDDFPTFTGLKRIDITGEVDGEERMIPDYLFLSTNQCVPLQKPWIESDERQNIIFGRINPQQNTIALDPAGIVGLLSTQAKLEDIIARNYAELDMLPATVQETVTKIEQQCDFYDDEQDWIIVLDGNLKTCKQEGNVIISPQQMVLNETMRKSVVEVTFDELLSKYCLFFQTVEQRNAFELEKYLPPEITVHTPLGGVYNTRDVEFSFTLKDTKDGNIDYEIYVDVNNPAAVIDRGTAARDELVTKSIAIPDGQHFIWVEANDSENNLGVSELHEIDVNVKNFIITVDTLDEITFDTSPDVGFTISHVTAPQVEYTVLINSTRDSMADATVVKTDLATIGSRISVPTNLKGTHILQVTAEDSSGDYAKTYPLLIKVKEGTQP